MSAKNKVSRRSGNGEREQAARGGKGGLPGVHENTALIPLLLRNARDLIAFLDTEGRRIYNSPSYGPLLGDPEKLVGSDSFGDVHPEDRERIRRIFRDTVRTGTGHRTEYRLLARDGTARVVQSEGSAIRDEENRVAGVVVVGRDITEERDAHAKLDAALRRQKALAEFSLFALREPNPSRAIERAATLVAEALAVDFGTVLELEADGKALRVVAGHNWPPHRLGTYISAVRDTQAGHALDLYRQDGAQTLEAPQPVAIEDLGSDGRFVNTFRVRELGVVSAVCVVVPTAEGPYGVLAAHSRARRRFDPVEIEFMQAVANVLSAALVNFRAQAALRRQTERLRIAQHAARMIVLDWDIRADKLEFSDSPVWLRGPVPEGTGKYAPFKEQVHPEDRAHFLAARQRTIEMLQAQTPEFRVVRTDGQVLWVRSHQTVITGADGKAARLIAALYDITEHKRAEQALAESEARFRALTELSSDWYWEQDDQFRFTTLSGPGAAAMSRGGDPSVYLGKARWEIPDLEHMEGDWSRHRAQLERHEPFRDLILGRRMNDGTLRYMSVSGEPVFDEAGGFKGYRGVASNITERKRVEQALRESEQRFQSFMDNVPANAFIKDSQLRYTWVNRAHELHRSDGLHDVLGCDDFQLRPPEVARALRQQDEEVLRAKGPAWFVNRIPTMERERHFLIVKFPLPDASGAPGVAGVGIDISEQYKLEQTVRQLLRRLVHAQEAERRKVAGDLHDLIGQKLTALSLGLDIVRQLIPDAAWGPLNPRLQQMSALLEETIAAVRNVMSELRPPMLDDHGLLPALHWYASLFEAQTALQVRVAGPELGPRLDREIEIALFRIAQEALTNAAKHSGGSRVRIQVERFAEHVRMCIEDDGRGFDERTLERATKPTSWGMSAMRERAHAFGGQLRVESRAPGAAIVVDVPLEHAD